MTEYSRNDPKRGHSRIDVVRRPDGYLLQVDGKAALTPRRAELVAPTHALAREISQELRIMREACADAASPYTRLALTVHDLGTDESEAWRAEILAYLRSDLLCFRAASPAELARREEAAWGPVLAWAEKEFGARIAVAVGIERVDQSEDLIRNVGKALEETDIWRLAAVKMATNVTGSALLALALLRRAFPVATLFSASQVDERFQAELWGADPAALARTASLEAEFRVAAPVLACLETEAATN
jgi:chaperone required for assembly of F1-ATPase